MSKEIGDITQEEIDRLYEKLKKEAEDFGYYLNPDGEFAKDLVRSLIINERRYGYWGCPCRLNSGEKKEDLDIICPCDYRDPDINEFDTCYCALYVSKDAVDGELTVQSIPERRPSEEERSQNMEKEGHIGSGVLPYPVWRCNVCGYLAARDEPPGICPICKAKKDRFDRFM